jgi:FADH2 O2-dependent halogenase
MLNLLPQLIMDAVAEQRFARERFASVEDRLLRILGYYDRLVSCSYTSFRDYDLWNAWYRMWVLGSTSGLSGVQSVFARYLDGRDHAAFDLYNQPPYEGVQAMGFAEKSAIFERAAALVESVGQEQLGSQEACTAIFELLAASDICPEPWQLTDPERRYPSTFTIPKIMSFAGWGQKKAPDVVKDHYFNGGSLADFASAMWGGLVGEAWGQARRSGSMVYGFLRDSLRSKPWPTRRR